MTKQITDKQYEQVEEFFNHEIPEYLEIVNSEKIKIKTDSPFLRGTSDNWHIVLFNDVIRYFTYEVNSQSGLRSLGTIGGDWRLIDDLADQCVEIFKIINPKKFKEILN